MEKVRPHKSKKQVITRVTSGIMCFISAFGALVAAAYMQEHNYSQEITMAVGLGGFAGFTGISLYLLLSVFQDAIIYDAEKLTKKYNGQRPFVFHGFYEELVNRSLAFQGFKEHAGYYRKKKFCFFRDHICYYAKCITAKQVSVITKEEIARFCAAEEKCRNVCLFLFVFVPGVEAFDLEYIQSQSVSLIVKDALSRQETERTCILVLADQMTSDAYFYDVDQRFSIGIYAYGCRYLKRLFCKKR